jgi:hypothetical protein
MWWCFLRVKTTDFVAAPSRWKRVVEQTRSFSAMKTTILFAGLAMASTLPSQGLAAQSQLPGLWFWGSGAWLQLEFDILLLHRHQVTQTPSQRSKHTAILSTAPLCTTASARGRSIPLEDLIQAETSTQSATSATRDA